jgi:hypothetical protein
VVSIELGQGSRALAHPKDPAKNEAVLRSNLRAFGVEPLCTVLMGNVEQMAGRVPDGPIALLFIDADGALDRDFGLFYRRLLPGAPVIVDDYACAVDEKLLGLSDDELERYLAQRRSRGKSGGSLEATAPLGKSYTTYRFLERLLADGSLTWEETLRTTFFGRKPRSTDAAADIDLGALHAIRVEIAREFVDLRAKRAD